ncbi:MAG: hypothetical protein RL275_3262 [Chloroflexota bacterium]
MTQRRSSNLKRHVYQMILLHICLAMLLSACVKTSCSLQAVAGGSQFCGEVLSDE